MSQWYSRQFGDTARFALRIAFHADPSVRVEPDEALAASWGSIEIWTRGRCLTRSADGDGGYADGVTWYLLPVLEWCAEHLDHLLNQEPFPAPVARDDIRDAADWLDASEEPLVTLTDAEEDAWYARRSDWREHHAIRSAVLDTAFPMVLFRRVGGSNEVSWDNDTWGTTHRPRVFTEARGATLVDARSVAESMSALLIETQLALRSRCRSARLLRYRGAAWEGSTLASTRPLWGLLMPPETTQAVGQLPDVESSIERAQPTGLLAEQTLETLALRSVRTSDPGHVRRILGHLPGATGPWPPRLTSLRQPADPDTLRPWMDGYAAADALRRRESWDDRPLARFGSWLRSLGVDAKAADLGPQVALMAVGAQDRNPAIRAAHLSDTTLAQGLGHLLLTPRRAVWMAPWLALSAACAAPPQAIGSAATSQASTPGTAAPHTAGTGGAPNGGSGGLGGTGGTAGTAGTTLAPIEVTDLASYTAACEQVLGPWPTFDCYDGVQVPVHVTRPDGSVTEAVTEDALQDGWRCDRPSHLQGCVPYGRIGTLVGDNGSTWTFVCRSYSTPHPDGSLTNDGQLRVLFEDLGVIAQHPVTGDTCFWAVPIDGRHFDGTVVPKPASAQDADFFGPGQAFWYTLPQIAGAPCTACHDNDPYIHTPWADQTGVVPSHPLVPYEVVARDVLIGLGGSSWSPARRIVHPDAANCVQCHELAERFTCGTPVDDATGRKSSWLGHTDAYLGQWPTDHWMDDFDSTALVGAWPTEESWDAEYAVAVDRIQQCCGGTDPDGLCWSP